MTKRTSIFIALGLVMIGLFVFGVIGYQRGRADFDASVDGKPMRYAREGGLLMDGGSRYYVGMGYDLCRMHRLLTATESGQADVYLIGVTLTWAWPIRWFARDAESLHEYAHRQKTGG
jgi:hypothetical protein